MIKFASVEEFIKLKLYFVQPSGCHVEHWAIQLWYLQYCSRGQSHIERKLQQKRRAANLYCELLLEFKVQVSFEKRQDNFFQNRFTPPS
ncbi:unnamed protein product [Mucor hiemalis]